MWQKLQLIAIVSLKVSRPWVLKWVWDARWAAVVVLELALFRQRPRPPGPRAPPLARLCARTQSENTVGKVLELWSQTTTDCSLVWITFARCEPHFSKKDLNRLEQSRPNRPNQLLIHDNVFFFLSLNKKERYYSKGSHQKKLANRYI